MTDPPRTVSGRALVGWVRPNLRAPYSDAIRRIEDEAARDALTRLRPLVAQLPGDQSTVLALIEEALSGLV